MSSNGAGAKSTAQEPPIRANKGLLHLKKFEACVNLFQDLDENVALSAK
jgi:hypothetical protein